MSSPTGRRLTAEERRAGIPDAALAVFSARGYHPSSIDDIAARDEAVEMVMDFAWVGLERLSQGERWARAE
jgi:hypothetical protein